MTIGRPKLEASAKLVQTPLRLLPIEVEQVRERAALEQVTPMEWKRGAIKRALKRKARKK